MLVLVVLCLVTGVAGVVEVANRRAVLVDVTRQSIPLAGAAQAVYQSLSDADATANGIFLAGQNAAVGDPAKAAEREQAITAQRQRYLADIDEAAFALSTAAAGASEDTAPAVMLLNAQLSRYSGLVETAQADNRQGLSVGAAYLREASSLVRDTMLVQARELYDGELARLREAQRDAGSATAIAIILGALTLAALVGVQLYLRRTTRRTLNKGLLAATVATGVAVGWLTGTSAALDEHTDAVLTGVERTKALAETRFTALTARSMEALALVARDDQGTYGDGYREASATLDDPRGAPGSFSAARSRTGGSDAVDEAAASWQRWQQAHWRIADPDRAAQEAANQEAGALATEVDGHLSAAFDQAERDLTAAAERAASSLTVVDIGVALLALAAAAGAGFGIAPRIREYR